MPTNHNWKRIYKLLFVTIIPTEWVTTIAYIKLLVNSYYFEFDLKSFLLFLDSYNGNKLFKR